MNLARMKCFYCVIYTHVVSNSHVSWRRPPLLAASVYVTVRCPSLCPSVCLSRRSAAATGGWFAAAARARAGDIDR